MMKQALALMLCAAMATSGCATAGLPMSVSPTRSGDRIADRAVMAEYLQKLPTGSAVRIERTGRRTMRATLMKATDRALYVQPRTRIAEPALEIPIEEIVSVTLEGPSNGTSIGKAIAAGAAAGAGVVLALILISIAVWSD